VGSLKELVRLQEVAGFIVRLKKAEQSRGKAATEALFDLTPADGWCDLRRFEQPLRFFQDPIVHRCPGCERKMAPAKGPSVLHAFSSHHVSPRMMMMVMTMHVHPMIHVVMHAFVHPPSHHRFVFGSVWCRARACGQRRQHVGNLLHWSLLGVNSPALNERMVNPFL
jgi:hypothetical protein